MSQSRLLEGRIRDGVFCFTFFKALAKKSVILRGNNSPTTDKSAVVLRSGTSDRELLFPGVHLGFQAGDDGRVHLRDAGFG